MKIKEAIAYAASNGDYTAKSRIAENLWPESSENSRTVLMNRLCRGDAVNINPEWPGIICRETGVTLEFLLSK